MRTAIITGAGSGIGLATAGQLAEAGFAILGVGRSADKLALVNDTVRDKTEVMTLALDITQQDAPRTIVEAAIKRWGRIDALINNAGVGNPRGLHATDDASYDYFVGLMLRAPMRLCREALGHMGAGSAIVNVTSTYAVVGGMHGGAYSVAKAGLGGFTRQLACDHGPRGIRANVVAPGVVPTAMTEHALQDPQFLRMNADMTPFPRLGTVDDVASAIAFLCSPGSSFLNGQLLVVDGGWSSTKYFSGGLREIPLPWA